MAKEKTNSLVEANMKNKGKSTLSEESQAKVDKVNRLVKMTFEALAKSQSGEKIEDDKRLAPMRNMIEKQLVDPVFKNEAAIKQLPLRDIMRLFGSDRYADFKFPTPPSDDAILTDKEAPESSQSVKERWDSRSTTAPIGTRNVISAKTLERIIGRDLADKMKDYNVDIFDPDYAKKNTEAWINYVRDNDIENFVANYVDKAVDAAASARKRPFNSPEEEKKWKEEHFTKAAGDLLTSMKDAFDNGKFDLKKSDQFKTVTKDNAKLKAHHAFEENLGNVSELDLAHMSPIEKTRLINKLGSGYIDWAGVEQGAKFASMTDNEKDQWLKEHQSDPKLIEWVKKHSGPSSEYQELLGKYGLSPDDIQKTMQNILHSGMSAQDWVDYIMTNPDSALRVSPDKTQRDKYTLNVQQGNDQVVQLKGPKEIRDFFRALNFVKGLYKGDDFKTIVEDEVSPDFKDLVGSHNASELPEGVLGVPELLHVFLPRGGNADNERYARFTRAMDEMDPSYFFGDVLKDLPKEYKQAAKEKMLDAFINSGKIPDPRWISKQEGEKYESAYDAALRTYGSATTPYNMFFNKKKDLEDRINSYKDKKTKKSLLRAYAGELADWTDKIAKYKEASDKAKAALQALQKPEQRSGLQRIIGALGLNPDNRVGEWFEKNPDVLRVYATGKQKLKDWLASRVTADELADMVKDHLNELPEEERHAAAVAIKPYLEDLVDDEAEGTMQDRIASFMRNVEEDAVPDVDEHGNKVPTPLTGFANFFTDNMYKQAEIKNIKQLIERKDILEDVGLTDAEDRLLNIVHNSQKPGSGNMVTDLGNFTLNAQKEAKEKEKAYKAYTESTNKEDVDAKNRLKNKAAVRRNEAEKKEAREQASEAKKYIEDAKANEAKNAAEARMQTVNRQIEEANAGAGWIPDIYKGTGIVPGTKEEAEWKENYPAASKAVGDRKTPKLSESEQIPSDKGTKLSPEAQKAVDAFNTMSSEERANEYIKNKKIRHDTIIEAKDKGDLKPAHKIEYEPLINVINTLKDLW